MSNATTMNESIEAVLMRIVVANLVISLMRSTETSPALDDEAAHAIMHYAKGIKARNTVRFHELMQSVLSSEASL